MTTYIKKIMRAVKVDKEMLGLSSQKTRKLRERIVQTIVQSDCPGDYFKAWPRPDCHECARRACKDCWGHEAEE